MVISVASCTRVLSNILGLFAVGMCCVTYTMCDNVCCVTFCFAIDISVQTIIIAVSLIDMLL